MARAGSRKTSTFPAQRTQFKVFVSSTFRDNEERRKVVRDAITMAGMVWHGMEIFTASTEPTVDECLRHAAEADLLVGIIAHRYGWIPKGKKKSITEMEYDAARDAGIDRLMFMLDPNLPVNPEEDFDPGPKRWKMQEKLAAFRERFRADQMPAFFNESTLQAKVLHALHEWRARRERREAPASKDRAKPRGPKPHTVDPVLAEQILRYRDSVDALHATLPVAGFVTQIKVPIDIENIYVPLHAVFDRRGIGGECYADATHAEDALRKCDAVQELALTEAFRQTAGRHRRGIVILGDPGAGKTTHLKQLLLCCLRKGPETLGLPVDMLPVFLPLRDLRDLNAGLDGFIQDQLSSPHLKTQPGFGKRLLTRGNLLFLLDGLDEVADRSERKKVAEWIEQGLQLHPSCSFVVTSRFAGYSPDVHLGAAFLELHIRPFSQEQSELFVRNWYRLVERGLAKDPEQAEGIAREKAESLINRLRDPDFRARRVLELTRNPLLLTNICLVHRHRGQLPQRRARLYEECIDVLLDHWRGAIGLSIGISAQEGRRALQPAALWLHGKPERTRAGAAELAPRIEPVLKAIGWNQGSARDFLRTVRDVSGLLTGWGLDQYGFMHLGFQEYLAAREIRSLAFKDKSVLLELASHFGESWWQEVTLLLLALEDPSLFEPFMTELLQLPAVVASRGLVDLCLEDASERSPKPFVELLSKPAGKDSGLWKRQFVALQTLERLDPDALHALFPRLARHPFADIRRWIGERKERGLQEVILADRGGYELVHIPGGEFLMGASKREAGSSSWEKPQHKVRVADFEMGRYPVTNEQYGLFLNENPGVSDPKFWAYRWYNQARQPVVGVSWEEAKRYADWAGLRLPTEAEWEYACRARTSTRFYTGNKDEDLERAGWYQRNSGDQLHPVGEKEPNGFGLYDMHGNVWEWVEDDYHGRYEGAPQDGSAWIDNPRGSRRVMRGGSFNEDAAHCRSAFRTVFPPGDRNLFIGFRLSRSVPLGP
ncbi:MAG: SUMF1/EgtB/PvdO family nonheme iron enzyme [Syntrophobacteraceae bacterium]